MLSSEVHVAAHHADNFTYEHACIYCRLYIYLRVLTSNINIHIHNINKISFKEDSKRHRYTKYTHTRHFYDKSYLYEKEKK